MPHGGRMRRPHEAEPARHDHQQRTAVHQRQLLTEKLGVSLRLAPELGYRPEIRGRGDQRDPERIAGPPRRLQQAGELGLLLGTSTSILRQEQRLCGQNVAGRITARQG